MSLRYEHLHKLCCLQTEETHAKLSTRLEAITLTINEISVCTSSPEIICSWWLPSTTVVSRRSPFP